jgi:hypothetical protein
MILRCMLLLKSSHVGMIEAADHLINPHTTSNRITSGMGCSRQQSYSERFLLKARCLVEYLKGVTNTRVQTSFAGFSLIAVAMVGLLSARTPTLYCPFPTLTIVPAFLLPPGIHWAAVLVPTVLFFAWNPRLLGHQTNLPKRTVAVVALLSALTPLDFFLEWRNGLQYQGLNHTAALLMVNLLWLGLLWWSTVRASKGPSFVRNLLTHWILFAWLSWYAFPYLGELP